MTKPLTAAKLISESIDQNKIVHVEGTPELHDELLEESDDHVSTHDEEGLVLTEYWGTTEEGGEWRIHVTQ